MFRLLLTPVRKSIADSSSEEKARIPSKISVPGGRECSSNLLGSHRIVLNEEYFGKRVVTKVVLHRRTLFLALEV